MSRLRELPHERGLAEVIERLDTLGLLISAPTGDLPLRGIADDSRKVGAAHLFCAWKGHRADGHSFLTAAAGAAASAALVERPVEGCEIPQVVVNDGRRAAGIAASLLYGEPADRLRLDGVTGTNGQTTTVWLLRHLLAAELRTATLGTLGLIGPDGRWAPGGENLTTPGPVALAAHLHQLVEAGVEAVAMEVSSHALEQARVYGHTFDVAVFTNLSRDHLDYHGTVEAYLEAKRSFVEYLGAEGTAIMNLGDPAWQGLEREAPRALGYDLEGPADLWVEDLELGASGADFDLVTGEGRASVELPLLGGFNVQNALAAASAALALGLPLELIAERLATLPQVPGRLELIADAPCPVLRDYAHTPDALERVLSAARPLVEGRLIVVFGAGGDRDPGKRPLMGSVAAQYADLAIVTSDNPRTEEPQAIIEGIVAGVEGGEYRIVVDRREAICYSLGIAGPRDLIILAGKGHETYQIVGTERRPFDEAEIVRELLLSKGGGE